MTLKSSTAQQKQTLIVIAVAVLCYSVVEAFNGPTGPEHVVGSYISNYSTEIDSYCQAAYQATDRPDWGTLCSISSDVSDCFSPNMDVWMGEYCLVRYLCEGWAPQDNDPDPFIRIAFANPMTAVDFVAVYEQGSRGWISEISLYSDNYEKVIYTSPTGLPPEDFKMSPPQRAGGPYFAPGLDYRGGVNVTATGTPCLNWNEQYLIPLTAYTGLGNHNYCRNPTNDETGPWCFTAGMIKESCGIPPSYTCDDSPLYFYPEPTQQVFRGIQIKMIPTSGAVRVIDAVEAFGNSTYGCFNDDLHGHFTGLECLDCVIPYKGTSCKELACGSQPCQFGYCSGENCVCYPGYYGADCSGRCHGNEEGMSSHRITSLKTLCSGHGVCSEGALGTGSCQCNPNYGSTGCAIQCPINEQNGLVCSGNGQCFDGESGNATCLCINATYGEDCSLVPCGGGPCYHGDCENSVCTCHFNTSEGFWGGTDCNQCAPGFDGYNCQATATSKATILYSLDPYDLYFMTWEPANKVVVRLQSTIDIYVTGTSEFSFRVGCGFEPCGCYGEIRPSRPSIHCTIFEDRLPYSQHLDIWLYIWDTTDWVSRRDINVTFDYVPSCDQECVHGYCEDNKTYDYFGAYNRRSPVERTSKKLMALYPTMTILSVQSGEDNVYTEMNSDQPGYICFVVLPAGASLASSGYLYAGDICNAYSTGVLETWFDLYSGDNSFSLYYVNWGTSYDVYFETVDSSYSYFSPPYSFSFTTRSPIAISIQSIDITNTSVEVLFKLDPEDSQSYGNIRFCLVPEVTAVYQADLESITRCNNKDVGTVTTDLAFYVGTGVMSYLIYDLPPGITLDLYYITSLYYNPVFSSGAYYGTVTTLPPPATDPPGMPHTTLNTFSPISFTSITIEFSCDNPGTFIGAITNFDEAWMNSSQVQDASVGGAVVATVSTSLVAGSNNVTIAGLEMGQHYMLRYTTSNPTLSVYAHSFFFCTGGVAPSLSGFSQTYADAFSATIQFTVNLTGKVAIIVRRLFEPVATLSHFESNETAQPNVDYLVDEFELWNLSPVTYEFTINNLMPTTTYNLYAISLDTTGQVASSILTEQISSNNDGAAECGNVNPTLDFVCTSNAVVAANNSYLCVCKIGYVCALGGCHTQEEYYTSLGRKGNCSCYNNTDQGRWDGSSCSDCQPGYFGSICQHTCSHGTVNSTGTGCDCTPGTHFTGLECDECPPYGGYFGENCAATAPQVGNRYFITLPMHKTQHYGPYGAYAYSPVTLGVTVLQDLTTDDILYVAVTFFKEYREIVDYGNENTQSKSSNCSSSTSATDTYDDSAYEGTGIYIYRCHEDPFMWPSGATTGNCMVVVPSGYSFFTVKIVSASRAVQLKIDLKAVPPGCCNGHGFCGHTSTVCDCIASPELGFYDEDTQCATCRKGFTGDMCQDAKTGIFNATTLVQTYFQGESRQYGLHVEPNMPLNISFSGTADCDLSVQVGNVCGSGWTFSNGRCLRSFSECVTQEQAKLRCSGEGGYLASLNSIDDVPVLASIYESTGFQCNEKLFVDFQRHIPPCADYYGANAPQTYEECAQYPDECLWDPSIETCEYYFTLSDCYWNAEADCLTNGTHRRLCQWVHADTSYSYTCLPGYETGNAQFPSTLSIINLTDILSDGYYASMGDSPCDLRDETACADSVICEWDDAYGCWARLDFDISRDAQMYPTDFYDYAVCASIEKSNAIGTTNPIRFVSAPCKIAGISKSAYDNGEKNSLMYPLRGFICEKPANPPISEAYEDYTIASVVVGDQTEQVSPRCELKDNSSSGYCFMYLRPKETTILATLTCLYSSETELRVSYVPRSRAEGLNYTDNVSTSKCLNDEASGSWAGDLCTGCAPRFSGPECTAFSPCLVGDCIHGTCATSGGPGVEGYCQCDSNYVGVLCDTFCDPSTCGSGACNENYQKCPGTWGETRECTSATQLCLCPDDFDGTSCEKCISSKWNFPLCNKFCNCNGQPCDSITGVCQCYADDIRGYWTFESGCSACATNYYGLQCNAFCNDSSTCSGHGSCTLIGTCSCSPKYYTPSCSVYCDISSCSQHGTCNEETGTCICYADFTKGFFSGTKCSDCAPGYWGSQCTEECQCSGRGSCDRRTGTCQCPQSPQTGYFSGERCQECAPGYSGSDCRQSTSAQSSGLSWFSWQYVPTKARLTKPATSKGSIILFNTLLKQQLVATSGTQIVLFEKSLNAGSTVPWSYVGSCDVNPINEYGTAIDVGVLHNSVVYYLLSGSDKSAIIRIPVEKFAEINSTTCPINATFFVELKEPSYMSGENITAAGHNYQHTALGMVLDPYFDSLYILYKVHNSSLAIQSFHLSRLYIADAEDAKYGFNHPVYKATVPITDLSDPTHLSMKVDNDAPLLYVSGVDVLGFVRLVTFFAPNDVFLSIRTTVSFIPEKCQLTICTAVRQSEFVHDHLFLVIQVLESAYDLMLLRLDVKLEGIKKFSEHYSSLIFAKNTTTSNLFAFDNATKALYIGAGAAPQIIQKIDAVTLEIFPPRFTHTSTVNEYSVSVAHTILQHSRQMILLNRATSLSVVSFNLYDVLRIQPELVDGVGGTLVNITGQGFQDLGENILCKFGDRLNSQLKGQRISDSLVICQAPMVTKFDPCQTVPLELSFDGVGRFTSNNVLVQHINSPVVTMITPTARVRLTSTNFITVVGTGFLNTNYLKCNIDGISIPAVFETSTQVRCIPPNRTQPSRTQVEVSLDGQRFSNNLVPFYIVGPPTYFTTTWVGQTDAYKEFSRALVNFTSLRIVFYDAAGTDVAERDEAIRGHNFTVSLKARIPAPKGEAYGILWGNLTKVPEKGVITFDDLYMEFPATGTYTIYINSTYGLNSSITFVIASEARKILFSVKPPTFSTNREKLTVQPILRYLDVSDNVDTSEKSPVYVTVAREDGSSDSASLDGNAASAVVITDGIVAYNALRIVGATEGASYILTFQSQDAYIPALLSDPIRVALCPASNNPISALQPDSSALGDVTITVKGWGYLASNQDYFTCKYGEGTLVNATFLDTCTLLCNLSQTTPFSAPLEISTTDRTTFTTASLNFSFVGQTSSLLVTFGSSTSVSYPSADSVVIDDLFATYVDSFGNWMRNYDTVVRWVYVASSYANTVGSFAVETSNSAVTITNLTMIRPPIGNYELYFSSQSVSSIPTDTINSASLNYFSARVKVEIVEGSPYRMEFNGAFSLFTTNKRKLDVQPVVRIADVSNNTVTDYSTTPIVTAEVSPTPLCLQAIGPGETQAEHEATCSRMNGQQVFVTNGIATFTQLQFKGQLGVTYVLKFTVTLAGIPPLYSPALYTADCPTSNELLDHLSPDWVNTELGGILVLKGWDFQPSMQLVLTVGTQRLSATYVDTCTAIVSVPGASTNRRRFSQKALTKPASLNVNLLDERNSAVSSKGIAFSVKSSYAVSVGYSFLLREMFTLASYNAGQTLPITHNKTCVGASSTSPIDCYEAADVINMYPIHLVQRDEAEGELFYNNGWIEGRNPEVDITLKLISQPPADTRPLAQMMRQDSKNGTVSLAGRTVNGSISLSNLQLLLPRAGDYIFEISTASKTSTGTSYNTSTYTIRIYQGAPVRLVAKTTTTLSADPMYGAPFVDRSHNSDFLVSIELHDVADNPVGVSMLSDVSRLTMEASMVPYQIVQPPPLRYILINLTTYKNITERANAFGNPELIPSSADLGTTNIDFTTSKISNIWYGLVYKLVFKFREASYASALGNVTIYVRHASCVNTQQYGKNFTATCSGLPEGGYVSSDNHSLFIFSKPGYWRYRFQDDVFYECPGSNCLGGYWSTCKKGTTGPTCAVCEKGWGKQGDACLECPSPAANISVIIAIGIAALVVVFILVRTNLSSEVEMKSIFSIIFKIFMNHLQTASLMQDFQYRIKGIVKDLLEIQDRTTPDTNFTSFSCLTGWNMFSVFLMWMLVPVFVILIPLLIVGIIMAIRALSQYHQKRRVRRRIERKRHLGLDSSVEETHLATLCKESGTRIEDEPLLAHCFFETDLVEEKEFATPPTSDVEDEDIDDLLATETERHTRLLTRRREKISMRLEETMERDLHDAAARLENPEIPGDEKEAASRFIVAYGMGDTKTVDWALPNEWEEVTSRTLSLTYWVNRETGECTWNRPPLVFRRDREPIQENGELEKEMRNKKPIWFNPLSARTDSPPPKPPVVLPTATLDSSDPEKTGLRRCIVCSEDFALYECHEEPCGTLENPKYFCEKCWNVVHSKKGLWGNHTQFKAVVNQDDVPRMEKKYEELYEEIVARKKQVPPSDIWIVTVFVVIFLIYPKLMTQIATMFKCVRIESLDRSFLEADMTIECNTAEYNRWMIIAQAFFFLYGVGIPLGGALLLFFKRNQLLHKKTLSAYGFLYSGYRMNRYFWEFVIMIRKMFIVFIIVFYSGSSAYQVMFGMWLISFFLILNIFLQPFQLKLYWTLENISLASVSISLNAAMLYQPHFSLEGVGDTLVTVFIFTVNLFVLLVFAYYLLYAIKHQIYSKFDVDGDGSVTMEEIAHVIRFAMWKRFGKKLRAWGFDEPKPIEPAKDSEVQAVQQGDSIPVMNCDDECALEKAEKMSDRASDKPSQTVATPAVADLAGDEAGSACGPCHPLNPADPNTFDTVSPTA